MNQSKDRNKQYGQSVSEFIIIISVLTPMMLALVSFSNLLRLDMVTVEASRLAAWSRVVLQPNDKTGLTEAFVDAQIKNTIDELYLKEPYTDFGPGQQLNTAALPSIVDRSEHLESPVSIQFVSTNDKSVYLASEGSRLARRISSSVGAVNGLVSTGVSIAVNKNYSLLDGTTDSDLPIDVIARRNQLNVSHVTPLITDNWSGFSGRYFDSATSAVAFDGHGLDQGEIQSLGLFQAPNMVFDLLGFQEVKRAMGEGYNTTPIDQEKLIPLDRWGE